MANFGDILSNLAIGAGKLIRRNGADSAFEAVIPSAVFTGAFSASIAAGATSVQSVSVGTQYTTGLVTLRSDFNQGAIVMPKQSAGTDYATSGNITNSTYSGVYHKIVDTNLSGTTAPFYGTVGTDKISLIDCAFDGSGNITVTFKSTEASLSKTLSCRYKIQVWL